jgi:hypothetical protein
MYIQEGAEVCGPLNNQRMRTQSFYFSSSPAAGAQNLSADGSQFEINFDTPLHVPAGATVCEMDLLTATVWNTGFNISAEFAGPRSG